ncbi:MAG TPA: trehalose-6-phosphate synthase [Bryobacteraceae bacterium]|jgi:trehalose 6-phosphate synthase|nr:trehalose-6-phosphate synthase [Bryobacteraceae bacterium]
MANPLWTSRKLRELIEDRLSGVKFIVVSNREPYIHKHDSNGEIVCIEPASGMATAIDPLLRASGGVWVAHGSGSADKETVDINDHVMVPPGEESYTLRRVWLDQQLEKEYYYGLSNEGLWPLCHIAFQRPIFRLKDWEAYRRANQIFADAVLEEAGDQSALVFIQDYHFGLLPRMLKDRNPNLLVAQFWHIPWPNRESFRVFPWAEELLDGMLGNDLLGFHIRHHCLNFLDTCDRNIESLVDNEHFLVTRGGHNTMVRPFPISIDFEQHTRDAQSFRVDKEIDNWLKVFETQPEWIGVGIDRIDYTKGIPDRLAALDLFLEKHPEFIGRILFVQIGVPTREHIGAYTDLSASIDAQVEAMNKKWQRNGWHPIHYHKGHCNQDRLMALHRLANFCLVSSLHDGMNLVAKEYVASRFDNKGVLILSQFTGSARELTDALLINPFSTDDMADAIYRAICMPVEEQMKRMQRMREIIEEFNIYRWAGKFLSWLLKFEFPDRREVEEYKAFASEASAL